MTLTGGPNYSARHDSSPTARGNYLAWDGHAKFLTLAAVSFGNGGPGATNVSPTNLAANNEVMTFQYQ